MRFFRVGFIFLACLASLALCACGDAPKTEEKTAAPPAQSGAAKTESVTAASPDAGAAGANVKSVTVGGETFHYAVDPCSMLSRAEAEKILGEPVGEPRFTFIPGIPPQAACTFEASVPEAERFERSPSQLRIAVIDPVIVKEAAYADADTVQKVFERHKAAFAKTKGGVADVDGLAEPGVLSFSQPESGTVFFVKGNLFVRVAAKISKKEQAKSMEELKARQAGRNLGAAVAAANSILPNID